MRNLALLLLLTLAACHPQPKPTFIERGVLALPSLADHNTPLSAAPDPADLFPLADHAWPTFVTLSPQSSNPKSSRVTATLTPQGDLWRWEIPTRSVVYLRRTDDGSIVITAEDSLTDNVHVEYDPPIPLLPADLDPTSKPLTGQSKMLVKNLSNNSTRDEGACRYTLELLGTQKLRTAAGRYEVIVTRATRRVDLKLADADVTILTAFSPTQGPVAQQIRRLTKALGLFPSRSDESHQRAPQ
ncbi:MAG: hypothetical protein IT442_10985 [Phycisphaeraceae bacterium]|nr:hypothetical protein [Phycisphaeraceae bacterium]